MSQDVLKLHEFFIDGVAAEQQRFANVFRRRYGVLDGEVAVVHFEFVQSEGLVECKRATEYCVYREVTHVLVHIELLFANGAERIAAGIHL